MRILSMRLKNLNSLVGEWRIDFTNKVYTDGGVFVVTGPTGAGKTTILDAICLALYGKTPRLESVNKSSNEIISRWTSDCYAEVTFETRNGKYRCHWRQSKVRGKADGSLKDPIREIVDATTLEIIASGIRDVEKCVNRIVGMDFTQFTRSILLAQGDFDQFLKAKPTERGEILERISGADLYTKISKKTHEIKSALNKKLEVLRAERSGIVVLDDGERASIEMRLGELRAVAARFAGDIEKNSASLAWLDGLARIEGELASISQRACDLSARMAAFEPNRTRLERAARALEASAAYAELGLLRRVQRDDLDALEECSNARPAAEASHTDALSAESRANISLEASKKELAAASDVIRAVRQLDIRITEKSSQAEAAQRSIDDHNAALNLLRASQGAEEEERESSRARHASLSEELESSLKDDALVERLALVGEICGAIGRIRAKAAEKTEELSNREKASASCARILEDRERELSERQSNLDADLARCAAKESELAAMLAGPISELRLSYARSLAGSSAATTALADARSFAEASDAFEKHDGMIPEIETNLVSLRDGIEAGETSVAALEEEERQAIEDRQRTAAIMGFDEARRKLRGGEPCPLCGATEHPFAGHGRDFDQRGVGDELKTLSARLKDERESLSDKRIILAGLVKELELTIERRSEASRGMDAARAAFEKRDAALPRIEVWDIDALESLRRSLDNEVSELSRTLDGAESLEADIRLLRSSIESSRDAIDIALREHARAKGDKESALLGFERVASDIASLFGEAALNMSRLKEEIAPYCLKSTKKTHSLESGHLRVVEEIPAPKVLEKIMNELSARRDSRIAKRTETEYLRGRVEILSASIKSRFEEIGRGEADSRSRQVVRDALSGELAKLRSERGELFGDRAPDVEESRVTKAVDVARVELESSTVERSRTSVALEKLLDRMSELEKGIAARSGVLESREDAFAKRITSLGFSGEEEYRSAEMPDEERARVRSSAAVLDDERAALSSMEAEARKNLDAEVKKHITGLGREEVAALLGELEEKEKEAHLETGHLAQRLNDDAAARAAWVERSEVIRIEEEECARWDALHRLIGAMDGKKYRDFVQGLTFGIMIDYANAALSGITDRYLLTGLPNNPDSSMSSALDLLVIDNYQAGVTRSTRNLSGGESFLVSMALALALSRMASNNVQVDSLFLDEGFGSLDEETLETVLYALSTLRRDGKLIGVISHIPALTERLGVQIKIVPRGRGRSSVSGPGCTGST
ncbi:MAG: AAA family ATPase [Synergistaceae bacterium]|jgi:exonuclease SbcC|nr:AAA family ATPase [Synergistaceae bacterium]